MISNKINEINVDEIKIRRNRKISHNHVLKLASSIREDGLLVPVFLNNNKEIIDGQHRVEAFKVLKKTTIPAIFVSKGKSTIAAFNSNSKQWRTKDYLLLFKERRPYSLVLSILNIYKELKPTHVFILNNSLKNMAYKSGDLEIENEHELLRKCSLLNQYFIKNQGTIVKDKKYYIKDFLKELAEHDLR